MNIATFSSGGNVFEKYERVNGVAFKIAASWDNCAILPHKCDDSAQLWDSSAIFQYRMECLPPHIYAA